MEGLGSEAAQKLFANIEEQVRMAAAPKDKVPTFCNVHKKAGVETFGVILYVGEKELKERGPELIRRRNQPDWPPAGFEYSVPGRYQQAVPSKFSAQAAQVSG